MIQIRKRKKWKIRSIKKERPKILEGTEVRRGKAKTKRFRKKKKRKKDPRKERKTRVKR